ncbi:hypothetical protein HYV57_05890 [Candidatus Peregrinibacteria bacterium]|nr:hypothetical protein [Candidatus Peregrinibacteria bacterium]
MRKNAEIINTSSGLKKAPGLERNLALKEDLGLERSLKKNTPSPVKNAVGDYIKRSRNAISLAIALSLPLAVRADTSEGGAKIESVGTENPETENPEKEERANFSPELENIFSQLLSDPAIREEISRFKTFLSGNTEGNQHELVRMIRGLDAQLAQNPLKTQFDDLVRAEIRKQDFSALDGFLDELGIPLSNEEKWALYFYITSILMGLGIAFDVIASNIGRFRKSKSVGGNLAWASELGASHIAFPVAGGAMAAFAIGVGSQSGHELAAQIVERSIGGLSMCLIGYILYQEIFKGEEDESENGKGNAVQKSRKAIRALIINLITLWAVSADALFSGPAKYIETILKYWKPGEIKESIVIGGIVVAICSMISGLAALKINKKYSEAISKDDKYSPEVVERIEKVCLAGESGILGYFALNAGLNQFLSMNVSRLVIALLSALGTATVLNLKEKSDKQKKL